jgi:sterol desaturase/sphingolipid hydroxylase (fatty acid hydroxylase superfamily)
MIMLFPWILIFGITAFFFVCERIFPGRELPESPAWYLRALLLNSCQIAIVVLSGILWSRWLPARPLFHFSHPHHSVREGLMGWFLGTFFFYWWHCARHDSNFLWRVCHQIHHSPARIELLTAFYKHPIEIAADSMLTATILYLILGASVEALFGTTFLRHLANISTTATSARLAGLAFFFSAPNTIPFIINWICTNSITETLHYGTDSSERSGRLKTSH